MKLWAVTGQEAPVKYVVKCYKKKVYWNIFHFYHLDHLCLFVMSQITFLFSIYYIFQHSVYILPFNLSLCSSCCVSWLLQYLVLCVFVPVSALVSLSFFVRLCLSSCFITFPTSCFVRYRQLFLPVSSPLIIPGVFSVPLSFIVSFVVSFVVSFAVSCLWGVCFLAPCLPEIPSLGIVYSSSATVYIFVFLNQLSIKAPLYLTFVSRVLHLCPHPARHAAEL